MTMVLQKRNRYLQIVMLQKERFLHLQMMYETIVLQAVL